MIGMAPQSHAEAEKEVDRVTGSDHKSQDSIFTSEPSI